MFSYYLDWKSFNVSLDAVESWMRTNAGPLYQGNSADVRLTLWFSDDPGSLVTSTIQAYWDSLDETCPEAIGYVSRTAVAAMIAELRAGIVHKTWDQMTATERKLVIGESITLNDLGYNIDYHIIPDGYEGYGDLGHDGYGDYT